MTTVDDYPIPAYLIQKGKVYRNRLHTRMYGERLPPHGDEHMVGGQWYLTSVYPTEHGLLGLSTPITGLKERVDRLERESRTDVLTGLWNRRAFDEGVQRAEAIRARHGTPWILILLDLDGLKSINDSLGHEAGDRAIAETALAIYRTARRSDKVYRLGGDEYAIICHNTLPSAARPLISRLKVEVRAEGYNISAGFAVGWDDVVAKADKALYRDKHS